MTGLTQPPTPTDPGRERRHTKQRAAVEAALVAADGFSSARELHVALTLAGSAVGLATVYRTLASMAADGGVDVLRTADGEARYRACQNQSHHHHLLCRTCGKAVEIEGPDVEEWADQLGRTHGFSDLDHTLELVGTCGDCAAN